MRISEVHALMKNAGSMADGPLTDPRTGQKRMQNRGVREVWRKRKHAAARAREANTNHLRSRRHRLGICGCGYKTAH
jgi:hypothetical protein